MADQPDISTLDRVATLHLDAADYQAAYDLLEPVFASGDLVGTDRGLIALHIGRACIGLASPDAAAWYLEEAMSSGDSATRSDAQEARASLDRAEFAEDLVHDEMVRSGSTAVLAAANDAYDNHDYETAKSYYLAVYQDADNPFAVGVASVGIARCLLATGDLDDVAGYLEIAEQYGADRADIAPLAKLLAERDAGAAAAADGVDPADFDEIYDAARAASQSGDWAATAAHLNQIFEAADAPGLLRGKAAYGLGAASIRLHDYDAAAEFFREAISLGTSEVEEAAQEELDKLAAVERADEIRVEYELFD